MKINQHKLFNIAAFASMLSLASCGSVFDDLKPCPEGVEMRFVYDYNLESSNSFPAQVDCLTLHIYDSDGKFVKTVTETSGLLADENWRMTLDLAPGDYHAVAYGGIECDKASFGHISDPSEESVYTDIGMRLKDEHIGKRLHDHFHGVLDFTVEENLSVYKSVVMKMTKTTNHLRVLLQNLDGTPVDGSDFDFIITDDNSLLDHLNNPVKGNDVTYHAWNRGKISTSDIDAGLIDVRSDGASDEVTLGYAELSTSRLHLSTSSRIIIRYIPEDREVASLPLATYLALGRSEADSWSAQEFLDRCSRWNLTFFLDKGNVWHDTRIKVNGWIVRINNMEM